MMDGEPVDQPAQVTEHLRGCDSCTQWRSQAEALAVQVRDRYATTPDLTENVLAAVADNRRQTTREQLAIRAGRRRLLRWAVGVAAIVQLCLAVPALLTAAGVSEVSAIHTSREMASFDIAVAVGFLLAAIRPERAKAFVPVAAVLAVCLGATSFLDVTTGLTGLVDEAGHMVALVQAGLLWALGRVSDIPTTTSRPVTT